MKPDIIWGAVERRSRKRVRRAEIPPLRQFLAQCNNPHAKTLSGRPGTHDCNEASALELEFAILELYQGNKINKARMADWLRLAYVAIDEARKQHDAIVPTRLPDVPTPQSSPFSSDTLRSAETAVLWRHALHQWITQHKTLPDRASSQAAIAMSAVLNGALVDPVKLGHLLSRLANNSPPTVAGNLSAYEFTMPFNGLGNHHLQRWFLDPITEMLIWRMPPSGNNLTSGKLLKQIGALMRGQGIPDEYHPTTLSGFTDAGTAFWSTRCSQIDIQAIGRQFATHSINPRSWQRFIDPVEGHASTENTDLPSGSPKRRSTSAGREHEANDQEGTEEIDPALLYPWLTDIDMLLDAPDLAHAVASTHALMVSYPQPMAACYLGWVLALLTGESSSRKSLALTTIARRVRATLPALVSRLGEENPADIDTPELQDHYSDLTGEAMPNVSTIDLANGLRDFHGYLVRHHGKQHIEREEEAFGDAGTLKPVDANLPSFDDYSAAQVWLDRQLTNGWSRDEIAVCKLVMTFAFRTGMRRMEIFGLQMADVQDHRQLHALIRKNALRRIKTLNSKRIIPLSAFMDGKERRLLKEWIARRRSELAAEAHPDPGSAYLFPAFFRANRLSWVDGITDRVCKAIREVSGDSRLFLHHLRHAFGTWTYLRLRAPDYPALASHFTHLPLTRKHLSNGYRLRLMLLHHDAGGPSRTYAFAVARLLGHSSPAVSLAHYVHSADLLLGAIVRRQAEDLPSTLIIAASGLTKSSGYSLHGQGLDALIAGCRHYFSTRKSGTRPKTRATAHRARTQQPVVRKSSVGITLDRCYGIVTAAVKRNAGPAEIADLLGLDEQFVEAFLLKAAQIGPQIGLTVRGGRLTSLPPRPRGDDEWTSARSLFVRLQEGAIWNPTLVDDGLVIHLRHFDNTKKDVLFHGAKDADSLRTYLDFLHALGVDAKSYQWVLRRGKSDRGKLPAWCEKLTPRWQPASVRVINPPSVQKAPSVANWIGVQSFNPDGGRATGGLTAAVMFFAAISFFVTGQAERNRQN